MFAGIDLHKRFSIITVINQEGKVVLQGRIPSHQGIADFLSSFSPPPKVASEASSNWECLFYFGGWRSSSPTFGRQGKSRFPHAGLTSQGSAPSPLLCPLPPSQEEHKSSLPPPLGEEGREYLRGLPLGAREAGKPLREFYLRVRKGRGRRWPGWPWRGRRFVRCIGYNEGGKEDIVWLGHEE